MKFDDAKLHRLSINAEVARVHFYGLRELCDEARRDATGDEAAPGAPGFAAPRA
jgi:hypothetical protein